MFSAAHHARATTRSTESGRSPAPPTTGRRWFWPALLVVCLCGAVVRFALRAEYLANHPLATQPTVDALTYWNWAGRIAAGQLSDGVPFFSAPLYPYLLGLLRASGGGLPTLYAIQILLDLLTAALLAWIAHRRFGAVAGLLAAAIFLLMLEPASFCLRALTATLQLALIGLAWLALLGTQRRRSIPRAVAAGAAIGLLAFSYPPAMFYLPIVGLWWWWNDGRRAAGLGRAAVVVAAGAAVISPATLHNYWVSGEFFPIQSVVGINFRQGNGPGARGTITMIPGTAADRENLFRRARLDFLQAHGRDGSWKEVDRYYRNQALAYWRDNPLVAAKLFALKAYWFLTGRNYGDIYQPTMERDAGVMTRFHLTPLHTAWLMLPALAAVVLWLRRFNRHLPELLLFATPLLVVVLFWFSPRYRLPAIPVIAAANAWLLWQALRGPGRWRWAVTMGAALLLGVGLGFLNEAVGFDRLAPYRAQFRNSIGLALAKAGKFDQAIGWYRQALAADPHLAEGHANLGAALARSGESQQALHHLRSAIAADPENPVFHDQLGRTLVSQQRIEPAIAQFRIALELDPTDAQLHNNLANALLLKDDVESAIAQYRAALALDATYTDAHVNLGRVLKDRGQYDAALHHLREALRFDDTLLSAHLHIAQIRLAQGDGLGCVAALRDAQRLVPEEPAIANELAWYLATMPGLKVADRAEALRLARRAASAPEGRTPGRLDTLAAALAANGQYAEAIRTAEEAVSLAEELGATEAVEQFRRRLGLYRAGAPYVEPITPAAP